MNSKLLPFLLLAFFPFRAHAETPFLVKDLNQYPAGPNPFQLTAASNFAVFSAVTPGAGLELWITDGTAAGTSFDDLASGLQDSFPFDFTVVNTGSQELIFFTATTPELGSELWRTDGTPAGTFPIDINSGSGSSGPFPFIRFNNSLLFTADDGVNGRQVWTSKGTFATTQRLPLGPGAAASTGSFGIVSSANSVALFAATDPANGAELWETDGTLTALVKDISTGASSSNPTDFTAVPALGKVFFVAQEAATGKELYVSDGTFAGTQLVKDINPGSKDSDPLDLAALGNKLVFSANTPNEGRELWISDGTAAGTTLVKDLAPGPDSFFGGNFSPGSGINRIFAVSDSKALINPLNPSDNPAFGLFVTDGTAAGTKLIADVLPGFGTSAPFFTAVSGGAGFFPARDRNLGSELFRSDGTNQGTSIVKDIFPGIQDSALANPAPFQGSLLFLARAPDGISLFKSDGTGAGTQLVKNLAFPGTADSGLNLIDDRSAQFGSKLVFMGTTTLAGTEVFATDGTAAGTALVSDIAPGSQGSFPENYSVVGNQLFFFASTAEKGTEPWVSDGTAEGTRLLKDIKPGPLSSLRTAVGTRFAALGNLAFFSADDGIHGTELWKSDGSEAGTQLVKDLNPLGASSLVSSSLIVGDFATLNGRLYFTANDGSGPKFFSTDGSDAGTVPVPPADPAVPLSSGTDMAVFKGEIFFAGRSVTLGTELWKTTGGGASAALVKDLLPGFPGSSPRLLTALGDTLVYLGNFSTTTGEELIATDGTADGIRLVKDIKPGVQSSRISIFTKIGSKIFFNADDGVHGFEPWVTDGTTDGTVMLADVAPGPDSGNVTRFVEVDGRVFFASVSADFTKMTIFETDGTPAGTKPFDLGATDIPPGGLGSVHGALVFGARDPVFGVELFGVQIDQCPDDPDKHAPDVCGCGVADKDGNANGIIDCLGSQELGARLDSLRSDFKGVRQAKNARQRRKLRRLVAEIKAELNDISAFVAQSAANIDVTGSTPLSTLVTKLNKAVRAALKTGSPKFAKNKKAANKNIAAFEQRLE